MFPETTIMTIPHSVLKERITKVEKKLIQQGLKFLVVYSTGSGLGPASHTHGYLRYLLDWDSRYAASVLVLKVGSEPILLVPNPPSQLFAKETMWFKDIRLVSQGKFGHETAAILRPLVSENEKIGYIGRVETPVPVYDALSQCLTGVTWVQADHIIDELRMIKDSLAIAFHNRAAEICDAMFQTFTREVRSGKMAYQLQADIEHTARYEGCEHASTFLAVGPVADRARRIRRECVRVPQPGDQILLAVFLMYEGHWGHAVRTGTIGQPSQEQQRAFDIAFEMEEAALECMKPGVNLDEVWKASARALKGHYPNVKDLKSWYWFKTGHGMGLDYSEPVVSDVFRYPYQLDEGSTVEGASGPSIQIEPGMLFELHPNVFIPNEATGAIGDMILVTESGYDILNKFPRELIIW
ncbi:MAG: aminopeptidase P family protein [Deltaproteobacteria bacterium]|nr:aminopeptidase P family protein [Deltaproteobacteria bacterium]